MSELKRSKKRQFPSVKRVKQREAGNFDALCPVFRFNKIDRDGKFAFDLLRPDFQHKLVLEKMILLSCMTWAEIRRPTHDKGKSKHHYLNPKQLSEEAKERIKKLKLEEYDDLLFSFALTNVVRLIGIRQDADFYVLWYDPAHGVSLTKRTK